MNTEPKTLNPVKHYLKTKHWRNAYDKIPETHRVYSNMLSILTIQNLCYDIQYALDDLRTKSYE